MYSQIGYWRAVSQYPLSRIATMQQTCPTSPSWVISDVLGARQPFPLCLRFQTYCCLAANDVQRHEPTCGLRPAVILH